MITAVMALGGGFIVYQIMKPAQNRDGPEAARRIMATADLARGKNQSGETEASELSVRVAEMDRQLADINGKNQQLSAETEALRMQLVEERKDALRTIDALNGQVQSPPSGHLLHPIATLYTL
jgi:TolA-binding protein